MMRAISEVMARAVRWSGIPLLIRNTVARSKASILLYHSPSLEVLERHLAYLVPRYRIITLSELVDAIRSGSWESVPPKALVITFDDGLRDNFALLELFKRYSVVPTIYVCSQIVGRARHYWFNEVEDPESLKALPNADRLAILERRAAFAPTKEYPDDPQALSRGEITEMSGYVDFNRTRDSIRS